MAHHAVTRPAAETPTSTATGEASLACAWCGQLAPGGEQPLTWSSSVEGSGAAAVRRFYCDRCSRENVRGIESKLDAAWW